MRLAALIIYSLIALFPASALAREEIDLLQQKFNWRAIKQTGRYNRQPLKLSANKYDLLVVKLQSPNSGIGEVSWRTKQEKFSNKRTYPFYVQGSTKPRIYYLNLKAYVKENKIDHLLFFGPDHSKLISLKAVKGSFSEKLAAGWQEFWGPRGREYTGSSFLSLKWPRLANKPIIIYIYWIIILSLPLFIITKRPKSVIILILLIWVMLEMSSAINNWLFIRKDLNYWGKSLEEKREMQNVKDFYGFVKFAEKKLPTHAVFALIADPKYPHITERAEYYLFPRKFRYMSNLINGFPEDMRPTYVLLFNKMPNKKVLKEYRMTGKFREGAYIFELKGKK